MIALRYAGLLVTLLVGLLAAGMYYGLEISVKSKRDFEANVSFRSGKNREERSASTTASNVSKAVSSKPAADANQNADRKEDVGHLINLTDRWISERSGKSYFIIDLNNDLRIFENDERHQRREVGRGARTESKVVLQFYSELDEVNGTLKMKVSEDGNSMTGHFAALDDPTRENVVRLSRSAP